MENQLYENRFQKHPIITLVVVFLILLLLAEISLRLYIRFSSDSAPTKKKFTTCTMRKSITTFSRMLHLLLSRRKARISSQLVWKLIPSALGARN